MTDIERECRDAWFLAEMRELFCEWYAERLIRQIWGITEC